MNHQNRTAMNNFQKRLLDRESLLRRLDQEKDFSHPARQAADKWSYTLSENGSTLGYSSPGSKILGFSESEGWADFRISSISRDRHGDVVMPRGCEKFLSEYASNPVVLFAHRSDQFPVALAQKPKTEGAPLAVLVEDDAIYSRAFFHLKTQESEDVFKLVCAEVLKGTSIGFAPVVAEFIDPYEQDEDRMQLVFDFGGLVFKEWKLLEYSIVPIPANQDACRSYSSHPTKIKSAFVKSALSHYAGTPNALVVGGFCLKELSQMSSSVETVQTETPLVTPVPEMPAILEETVVKTQDDAASPVVPELPVPPVAETEVEKTVAQVVQEDKSVLDTIAAETPAEKSPDKEADSPKEDEDDMPYGCKVLSKVGSLASATRSAAVTLTKKLESPPVSKFVSKLIRQVGKLLTEANTLGTGRYKEKFQELEIAAFESADGDEEDEKSADSVTVTKEVVPAPVITPVITPESEEFDLKVLEASLDRISEILYKLTGVEI